MSHRRRPTPTPTPPPTPIGFTDTFNTGALSSNWIVSTWAAPFGGKFSSANISLSQGMLGIRLTQSKNPDGTWGNSVGGELQCKQLFGYGTYEWECRASSTSQTPYGVGAPVSGSITGCFNYINDSQTEIDFEVEGLAARSNLIQFTNWSTQAAQQSSVMPLTPTPEAGFRVYKFVWAPGQINFYVDGVLLKTHTKNVPTTPAYAMINHWGTNNQDWGGAATQGDRWMWVKRFSFVNR